MDCSFGSTCTTEKVGERSEFPTEHNQGEAGEQVALGTITRERLWREDKSCLYLRHTGELSFFIVLIYLEEH